LGRRAVTSAAATPTGCGSRTTWTRGDAIFDATALSAFAGTDNAVRGFPPSNKVPTQSFG